MEVNINLPEGASNHGNPNLLCLPPNWYDYIIFYFTNYFAHALTVLPPPGQAAWEAFFVGFAALLLPGSSVARAVRAILRGANLRRHPLRRAARAGALCMLIKSPSGEDDDPESGRATSEGHGNDQEAAQATPGGHDGTGVVVQPDGGTDVSGQPDDEGVSPPVVDQLPPEKTTALAQQEITENSVEVLPPNNPSTLQGCWWKYNDIPIHPATQVFGERRIPDGYHLVLVPPYVPLEFCDAPDESGDAGSIQRELACSYNVPKLLVSLAQAVWASITIYRARGDQIDRYGYAAFGLTVVPYAFMSVINIIAGLLTPEYPAMFMIRTPIMDEAERSAGAFFGGEIRVKSPRARSTATYRDIDEDGEEEDVIFSAVGLVMGLVPLAIVGGLSRFQTGGSTSVQRGFTMSWLVLGIAMGSALLTVTEEISRRVLYGAPAMTSLIRAGPSAYLSGMMMQRGGYQTYVMLSFAWGFLVMGVCAIGGMVVVGLMIRDYGICMRVD